jgi:hypothetical protein
VELVAALAVLAGAPAVAAPGDGAAALDTSASLDVDAPPGCAARADLVARVALRSARIRFVAAAGDVTALRAQIATAAAARGGRVAVGGVAADLTIVRADGRHATRHLVAASCDEAVDALALMIAILLDPAAAAEPIARAAPAGGGPGGGADEAAPAPRVTEAPREDVAAGAVVVRSPPPSPPPPPAGAVVPAVAVPSLRAAAGVAPPSPPRRASVRRWGVGASLRAVTGPAPRIMLGAAVDVVLAIDRDSVWSPALRLTAAHHALSGWAAPGGTAAFTLDLIEAQLCPLRLRAARLDLRGCATAAAGRLRASGSDTFGPESHARLDASVGAAAVIGLALTRRLSIEGVIGAGDALRRDAFEFSPAVFHRVPALTAATSLGLAAQFP